MTAEIAIINRSAVTLATDSAVTLRVRGADKVYNSADKLFDFAVMDPIGVMIYNNLEYMGIGLDVAIKQFREMNCHEHFDSVFAASEEFFRYLLNNLAPSEDLQKEHAGRILFPFLKEIGERFNNAIRAIFRENGQSADINYPAFFMAIVKNRIEEIKGYDISDCFTGVREEDIADFYSDAFDDLINNVFSNLPLDDEHHAALRELCLNFLIRNYFSDSLTGIVFAGFGEHEKFPSLVAYQIDGVVFNKLKKVQTDRVVTDREKITGEILPFAQSEMVERFLYGVDPEFEGGIEHFLEQAIISATEALISSLPRTTKATRAKLQGAAETAKDVALKLWREKMMPSVKNKFMEEVQDMVFLMPKQELATLALELINLTSVKKKFSSGRETVGGPIDVAVISRIDGFVWVKRKHYFEPELNPRYFVRKFGAAH